MGWACPRYATSPWPRWAADGRRPAVNIGHSRYIDLQMSGGLVGLARTAGGTERSLARRKSGSDPPGLVPALHAGPVRARLQLASPRSTSAPSTAWAAAGGQPKTMTSSRAEASSIVSRKRRPTPQPAQAEHAGLLAGQLQRHRGQGLRVAQRRPRHHPTPTSRGLPPGSPTPGPCGRIPLGAARTALFHDSTGEMGDAWGVDDPGEVQLHAPGI
jgi:hypothetical protein